MGDNLPPLPVSGEVYHAAVGANMVVFHRHWHLVRGNAREVVARWQGEVATPGKTDVHILGIAIAVELPDAGHLHRRPVGVVEVGAVEVGGALIGICHPAKFPWTFERQVTVGGCHVAFQRRCLVLVGKKRRVQRQAVHLVHLRVVPLRPGGLLRPCGHSAKAKRQSQK